MEQICIIPPAAVAVQLELKIPPDWMADLILVLAAGHPPNQAVRFFRPVRLSARVFVMPPTQGLFTHAGGLAAFPVTITNTGTLGADTYKLTTSSPWAVSLFAADGATPLTDTDGDGTVDTGSIPQAGTLTITVKVQTPLGAVLGDSNAAILTARSKKDSSRRMTASLKTAVPAPFVQGFAEDQIAVSVELAQPRNQVVADIPGTCDCGQYEMAIAKMTGQTYIYAWWNAQWVAPVPHSDMDFTILDNTGYPILPVTRLTINDAVKTTQTYDISPAVAVTPDGHIGIMWLREVDNSDSTQETVNVFFAILDASGQVVWGPTNLTNNSDYISVKDDYQMYTSNQVSATGDNHFLLAWQYAARAAVQRNCRSIMPSWIPLEIPSRLSPSCRPAAWTYGTAYPPIRSATTRLS